MTAGELYELIFFVLDKNGSQGDITTDEFNIIINRAQYSYQSFLVGQVQQYQYGRPIARIDYSQNQKIREKITPFVYNTTLTVTSGLAMYPSNYVITDAMLTTDNKVIKFVSQDRLANYLNSEIDPVATNPIYTIAKEGFTFYPDTITEAKLTFIRKADRIIYAVALDGNNREVYDDVNSADPEWDDLDCLEVAVRALAIMGVPLQLQQVQAYAQNIKQNGQ